MEQTKIFAIFVCRSNFNGKMGSRPACWDSGRPTKQALFQMPFSFSLHDFTWVGDFRRGGAPGNKKAVKVMADAPRKTVARDNARFLNPATFQQLSEYLTTL